MKRACFAETEAEAQAIAEVLRDHGIDAHLIPHAGPYPSLALGRWGEVRVPDERLTEAIALIEAWRSAPVTPPEMPAADVSPAPSSRAAPASSVNPIPWLLLIVSVALNVVLLGRGQKTPEPDAFGVLEHRDEDDRVVQREKYRPGSTRPFRVDALDVFGKQTATWFDLDEDGLYERTDSYEIEGRVTESYDNDKDGFYELSVIKVRGVKASEYTVLEDGTSLQTAKLGKTDAKLRDRDGDGFEELASCATATVVKTLDLRRCEHY